MENKKSKEPLNERISTVGKTESKASSTQSTIPKETKINNPSQKINSNLSEESKSKSPKKKNKKDKGAKLESKVLNPNKRFWIQMRIIAVLSAIWLLLVQFRINESGIYVFLVIITAIHTLVNLSLSFLDKSVGNDESSRFASIKISHHAAVFSIIIGLVEAFVVFNPLFNIIAPPIEPLVYIKGISFYLLEALVILWSIGLGLSKISKRNKF